MINIEVENKILQLFFFKALKGICPFISQIFAIPHINFANISVCCHNADCKIIRDGNNRVNLYERGYSKPKKNNPKII